MIGAAEMDTGMDSMSKWDVECQLAEFSVDVDGISVRACVGDER
jgi:hypothetical protein